MVIVLGLLVFAGIALVFLPSVGEWLRPADSVPLPIASAYSEDLHRGVDAFKTWREEHQYFLATADAETLKLAPIHAPIDVTIPSGTHLRAFFGEQHVWVEPGVTVEHWLHGANVTVMAGARLSGNVQADETVELHADVHFERLHATEVRFGPPSAMAEAPTPGVVYEVQRDDTPRPVRRGSYAVPGSCLVDEDLIVTGDLTVGPGTRVRGSVKAGGRLLLERGAVVEGNAVADGDVMLGTNARVHGVVSSESNVFVSAHARVGLPSRLTTLSAEHVHMSPGSAVHGTVWARTEGVLA